MRLAEIRPRLPATWPLFGRFGLLHVCAIRAMRAAALISAASKVVSGGAKGAQPGWKSGELQGSFDVRVQFGIVDGFVRRVRVLGVMIAAAIAVDFIEGVGDGRERMASSSRTDFADYNSKRVLIGELGGIEIEWASSMGR